ncbi:hypothetical protein [Streptomyces longispororuber]|uniref:hypothetical protein n=1 Tax=Streptomyces longispororuber TaxID=68230 RepID=UPI00210E1DD4|nr:hypothetical protein [Streptomyces longispororuber]MCQ4213688.1 hypothetical protein [Streptomyces longispororuber]
MTRLEHFDRPVLRPRKITRVGVDALIHTVSQEFTPDQINLSTDYRIPRQWSPGTRRSIYVNGAHALDELLDDPRIRRELPAAAAVELTQLTLDAEAPGRHIHVAMTRQGVTALIEADNRDWVTGRSQEVKHAVEDGHHPAWAVWRVSRRRGYLVAGLALDLLAVTLAWFIAGSQILHSAAALTIALIALLAIPAAAVAVGDRFVHRCIVKIRKTSLSWFWTPWSISERIAFCALFVTLVVALINLFIALGSADDSKGLPAPTHAPNITATERGI